MTYAIELIDTTGNFTWSLHALFCFGFCMLFYYRFRLPFALFAGGIALFIAILSVANLVQIEMLNVVEPRYGRVSNFDNFFNITHSPILALTTLAYGCIAFVVAMRFDLRDPYRLTRYAQAAFWLHLLAGPAIVNTVASTLYTLHSLSSLVVLAITILIIATISIVIDRRSMLMSAAIYLALLLYEVFDYTNEDGDQPLTAFFVMLVMGAGITLLGAHWVAWRGRLMRALPNFPLKDRLPPYVKEQPEKA